MTVNVQAFYRATDPGVALFINNAEIDKKYYIDFSPVRGGQVIKKLKKTILWSEGRPTCQLFTGHIGCGKSTELLRLKQQLEAEKFHVVYVDSTNNLHKDDVDITDILLNIVQEVSKSLESWKKLNLNEPIKFKAILKRAAELLQTEIEISPQMELSLGIAKITAQAKKNDRTHTKLRNFFESRTGDIIAIINQELIKPANKKLQQYGKQGLVVIADNLDRIKSVAKDWGRPQPEYLFVDRGEELMSLNCHLIYTIPLALMFSDDYPRLTEQFKREANLLPMVATHLRDGSEFTQGMELVRQLVLARAFPELSAQKRLAKVKEIFDTQETLDYLCCISGGHVRNVLRIVNEAIMEEDKLPISRDSIDKVIKIFRNQRRKAIDDKQWELLRRVVKTQTAAGDEGYKMLIRSMFVFEYTDDEGSWFDVNPLLKDAPELNIN